MEFLPLQKIGVEVPIAKVFHTMVFPVIDNILMESPTKAGMRAGISARFRSVEYTLYSSSQRSILELAHCNDFPVNIFYRKNSVEII